MMFAAIKSHSYPSIFTAIVLHHLIEFSTIQPHTRARYSSCNRIQVPAKKSWVLVSWPAKDYLHSTIETISSAFILCRFVFLNLLKSSHLKCKTARIEKPNISKHSNHAPTDFSEHLYLSDESAKSIMSPSIFRWLTGPQPQPSFADCSLRFSIFDYRNTVCGRACYVLTRVPSGGIIFPGLSLLVKYATSFTRFRRCSPSIVLLVNYLRYTFVLPLPL